MTLEECESYLRSLIPKDIFEAIIAERNDQIEAVESRQRTEFVSYFAEPKDPRLLLSPEQVDKEIEEIWAETRAKLEVAF